MRFGKKCQTKSLNAKNGALEMRMIKEVGNQFRVYFIGTNKRLIYF